MFLSPTPPRLTRRSRLDNWFLLLLRATVFGLLAFASCISTILTGEHHITPSRHLSERGDRPLIGECAEI